MQFPTFGNKGVQQLAILALGFNAISQNCARFLPHSLLMQFNIDIPFLSSSISPVQVDASCKWNKRQLFLPNDEMAFADYPPIVIKKEKRSSLRNTVTCNRKNGNADFWRVLVRGWNSQTVFLWNIYLSSIWQYLPLVIRKNASIFPLRCHQWE